MSLINGALAGFGFFPSVNPNLSTDLELYEFFPQPERIIDNLSDSKGATRAVVLMTTYPETRLGAMTQFYGTDFYERIHLAPPRFDLGNLTSDETRDLIVWNAYTRDFKQLLNIDTQGNDGITVQTSQNPPTFFAPLEERLFTFNISTIGPSTIDATYTFNFQDANDPVLRITGNRVVRLAFKPLMGFVEKLEWKTDIIPTFNGEQRIGLRLAPRVKYDYRFHFDDYDFSRIKAIANQWAYRTFALPVWMEGTFIGTVSLGQTEILFDTSFADYRPGSTIAVVDNDLNIETAVIDQVLSDRLTLTLPFASTLNNASVYPVRFARTESGFIFDRNSKGHIFGSATFHVTDNVSVADAGTKPQYKGLDVLIDCPVMVSQITERILQSIDLFDNGSGPVEIDISNNILTKLLTSTFFSKTREERWKLRQFLHKMQGRKGTFWLPSFNNDVQLTQPAIIGTTKLFIRPLQYPTYYGVTDIAIVMKNGTIYYNRVLSGEIGDNGEELNLENPLPITLELAEVDKIMFMLKVRFDSDVIEIEYPQLEYAQISVPVREVVE